jgi:hypothetical protein
VLNLLWGADNVGKIWSACGRHKIQYIEWWMNNFMHNYMHYITSYFSKHHMQWKYTDNKRRNSRQLATRLGHRCLAHFYKMSQLYFSINKMKVKQSLHRPYYRPWGFQEVENPRFPDNRHTEMVRLSALRTGRLHPPGIFLVLDSVRGHSATGKIKSMKNANFPACSALPRPAALPRAPPQTNCL